MGSNSTGKAQRDLPPTMHAWRKHKGNQEPVLDEVPVPQTPADGFLCKMLASGVCHSDHALLTNDNQGRPWFRDQYILGHEGCGEIIDIGRDVHGSKFKVGDRVAMFAVPGCGSDDCSACSRDLMQLCQHGHHSGLGEDGFFAPYATINARGVVALPEGVSPLEGAVATDAVTTAYHAVVRRGQVKSSETVFLFGLGGLGFNALQVIKHIGARVIVSDLRQETLNEAARIGIPTEDIVPAGTSVPDFVKDHNLQDSIDTVLDFVGLPQTFKDAQDIVRLGGKLVCVGTLGVENTLSFKTGVRKRLTILFSYGGQIKDLEEALELISKGSLKPSVESAKLKDFPRMLQDLCDGKIKSRVALVP